MYIAGNVCSVLIKEVSLVYTHLYVAGNVYSVHMSTLRRCPYFRGSLYASLCSWEGIQRMCLFLGYYGFIHMKFTLYLVLSFR